MKHFANIFCCINNWHWFFICFCFLLFVFSLKLLVEVEVDIMVVEVVYHLATLEVLQEVFLAEVVVQAVAVLQENFKVFIKKLRWCKNEKENNFKFGYGFGVSRSVNWM